MRLDGAKPTNPRIIVIKKRKIPIDDDREQIFNPENIEKAREVIGKIMFSELCDPSNTVQATCKYYARNTAYDVDGNKLYPTKAKAIRRNQIEKAAAARKKRKLEEGGTPPKKKRKQAPPKKAPAAPKKAPAAPKKAPAAPVIAPAAPVIAPAAPETAESPRYTLLQQLVNDMLADKITSEEAKKILRENPQLLDTVHELMRKPFQLWGRA